MISVHNSSKPGGMESGPNSSLCDSLFLTRATSRRPMKTIRGTFDSTECSTSPKYFPWPLCWVRRMRSIFFVALVYEFIGHHAAIERFMRSVLLRCGQLEWWKPPVLTPIVTPYPPRRERPRRKVYSYSQTVATVEGQWCFMPRCAAAVGKGGTRLSMRASLPGPLVGL
jgi:hypothetical protein